MMPMRYAPLLSKIEKLRPEMVRLSDDGLKAKTVEFRMRLSKGESLDHLLPEAFAVVREASRRVLHMEPYPVQLIGGMILHEGNIAEMKTGEGKTLVAALPSYLHGLTGRGVHVITVNDYLAQRDANKIGLVHRFLGLTVGCVLHDMDQNARRAAYAADITYVTNNECGFDYLRDNMVYHMEDKVQRGLVYCIIDEADSILIDEARTPLIISRQGRSKEALCRSCDLVVRKLKEGKKNEEAVKYAAKETGDYIVDEKEKTVVLTEDGQKAIEAFYRIDNLSDPQYTDLRHCILQALKAHALMHIDKDYIVKDGEVLIVDEFTGRVMKGRRFSDGLHQAIEAKEGVEVKTENTTCASVSFQHFFNYYEKKSGMTGTAMTEKQEFKDIYHMDVIAVPTNRPVIRKDLDDRVYLTKNAKYKAVLQVAMAAHAVGQPILIGTPSVEVSEIIHRALIHSNIPHTVLNAKNDEQEAQIVAHAGEKGAVTVATNMAGRGTDIKLSPGVDKLGGLLVLGTDHHESRRVDNQLRGRSGRQGDPGMSVFYVSLEDDLMKLYGGDSVQKFLEKMGTNLEEPIKNPSLTKAIGNAQKRVEAQHYSARKSLLDFDDVNDEQRRIIYAERDRILSGKDMEESIKRMAHETMKETVKGYADDPEKLPLALKTRFAPDLDIPEGASSDEIEVYMNRYIDEKYEAIMHMADESDDGGEGKAVALDFFRRVFLKILDRYWINHIDRLEHIREGIGMESYGQKDPKVVYRTEAYQMFDRMLHDIRLAFVHAVYCTHPKENANIPDRTVARPQED